MIWRDVTAHERRRATRISLGIPCAAAIGFCIGLVTMPASATDGETKTISVDYGRDCGKFEGTATHRLNNPKDSARFAIKAASYWNASGLILEKGVTYHIAVDQVASSSPVKSELWWNWCDAARGVPPGEDQKWCDEAKKINSSNQNKTTKNKSSNIARESLSPGIGWWPRQGEDSCWFRLLLNLTRWMSREPGEKLFYLMGALYGKCDDGRACGRQFPIGLETTFTAPTDGEFCAFANDYPTAYGNNAGAITVLVTRE
jgi:hypothetical protein